MPKQEGADPIEEVEETDYEDEESVEVVKESDADTSSGSYSEQNQTDNMRAIDNIGDSK